MTHLETELAQLKQAILEMMELAGIQMEKAKDCFLNRDQELAQEVIHNEKRANAMEISIDRDCENIFALFNPVATDLRFVISMLKINSDLERIADYADSIADYVMDMKRQIPKDAIEATRLVEMFDITIAMVSDIHTAFDEEDMKLARKVYQRDSELNLINANASDIIGEFIKKDPDSFRPLLFLFSIIRKLERVGDHVKNIAEDMIFHLEAKRLKHKKKLKT